MKKKHMIIAKFQKSVASPSVPQVSQNFFFLRYNFGWPSISIYFYFIGRKFHLGDLVLVDSFGKGVGWNSFEFWSLICK